tara:strand:+ start:200 stop:850 length:651 start_codon:yes stop_codon:yes gene_type:complete
MDENESELEKKYYHGYSSKISEKKNILKYIERCIEQLNNVLEFYGKGPYGKYNRHENHCYIVETYRGPQLPKSLFDKNIEWQYGKNNKYAGTDNCIENVTPKIHDHMKKKNVKGIITITFTTPNYNNYFKMIYLTVTKDDFFVIHRSFSAEINKKCFRMPNYIHELSYLIETFREKVYDKRYSLMKCNSCYDKEIKAIEKLKNEFFEFEPDYKGGK